ncbi:CHAT domain-containing protein [Streptomyces sp. NPDC004609]|uniref:CHAT domain-containing protein n=1 Tax=Streptomyces sp. NPDC004609 TaxID=3364704 RepID=UPI00369EA8FE
MSCERPRKHLSAELRDDRAAAEWLARRGGPDDRAAEELILLLDVVLAARTVSLDDALALLPQVPEGSRALRRRRTTRRTIGLWAADSARIAWRRDLLPPVLHHLAMGLTAVAVFWLLGADAPALPFIGTACALAGRWPYAVPLALVAVALDPALWWSAGLCLGSAIAAHHSLDLTHQVIGRAWWATGPVFGFVPLRARLSLMARRRWSLFATGLDLAVSGYAGKAGPLLAAARAGGVPPVCEPLLAMAGAREQLHRDDPAGALLTAREATREARRHGGAVLGWCLAELSRVHRINGDDEAAAEAQDEALPLLRGRSRRRHARRLLLEIGERRLDTAPLSELLREVHRMRLTALRCRDHRLMRATEMRLVRLMLRVGNTAGARAALRAVAHGEDARVGVHDTPEEAVRHRLQAAFALVEEERTRDHGRRDAMAALAVLDARTRPLAAVAARLALARAQELDGDEDAALAQAVHSLVAVHEARYRVGEARGRRLWERMQLSVYATALRLAAQRRGPDAGALVAEIMETARGEVLPSRVDDSELGRRLALADAMSAGDLMGTGGVTGAGGPLGAGGRTRSAGSTGGDEPVGAGDVTGAGDPADAAGRTGSADGRGGGGRTRGVGHTGGGEPGRAGDPAGATISTGASGAAARDRAAPDASAALFTLGLSPVRRPPAISVDGARRLPGDRSRDGLFALDRALLAVAGRCWYWSAVTVLDRYYWAVRSPDGVWSHGWAAMDAESAAVRADEDLREALPLPKDGESAAEVRQRIEAGALSGTRERESRRAADAASVTAPARGPESGRPGGPGTRADSGPTPAGFPPGYPSGPPPARGSGGGPGRSQGQGQGPAPGPSPDPSTQMTVTQELGRELELLSRVSAAFLPPVLAEGLARHTGTEPASLVVSLPAVLGHVPVAALPLAPGHDRRVVDVARVVHVPGWAVVDQCLRRLPGRTARPGTPVPLRLAVLSPDAADGTATALEPPAAARHTVCGPLTKTQLAYTLQTFDDTDGLLYLAGHIDTVPGNPYLSGLRVAPEPDGTAARVSMADMLHTPDERTSPGETVTPPPFPVPTHVLAVGCGSLGLQPPVHEGADRTSVSEWLGFGSALLLAGADHVVCTLYTVHPSRQLEAAVRTLTEGMSRGIPPADVLREMQLAQLRRWRHQRAGRPFVWQSFAYSGVGG